MKFPFSMIGNDIYLEDKLIATFTKLVYAEAFFEAFKFNYELFSLKGSGAEYGETLPGKDLMEQYALNILKLIQQDEV